jgi:hypothetical protein
MVSRHAVPGTAAAYSQPYKRASVAPGVGNGARAASNAFMQGICNELHTRLFTKKNAKMYFLLVINYSMRNNSIPNSFGIRFPRKLASPGYFECNLDLVKLIVTSGNRWDTEIAAIEERCEYDAKTLERTAKGNCPHVRHGLGCGQRVGANR